MMNSYRKLSLFVLAVIAVLQFVRWPFFPQFMDTYYHLHTAWGFNAAGGWSLWDFWEYAPAGRVHLYPPLFHFVLAVFLKLGADPLVLAQWLEALVPLAFLAAVWRFGANRMGERYGAFVLVICAASFRFFTSLTDHLPSTVAMTLGLLCLDRYYRKDFRRAALLVTLCLYTHVGTAWFIVVALALLSILERSWKGLAAAGLGCLAAAPVLAQTITGLSLVSRTGAQLNESLILYLKPVELLLALAGVVIVLRKRGPFLLVCLLAASAVFIAYPARLVSGEGYLSIVMLAAFSLEYLCSQGKAKSALALAAVLLAVSPVFILARVSRSSAPVTRAAFFDSVPQGLLMARGFSLTVIKPELRDAADIIRRNSGPDGILCSNLFLYSVMCGAVSGRATADGLLPETQPAVIPDMLSVSALAVMSKDEEGLAQGEHARRAYGFVPAGDNKFFIVLKNPSGGVPVRPARPFVTFPVFYCAAAVVFACFLMLPRL